MDVFSGSIQSVLKQMLQTQIQYQKEGNYAEAEQCRIKYQKQKQDYRIKTMNDMSTRHKNQEQNLQKSRNDELQKFNLFWNSQMDKYQKQSTQMKQDLQKKHNTDLQKSRNQLDRNLPIKLKQSSDLLNLRKMQQHMAKQKNYPEAQKIQQKIKALEIKEKQIWDTNRKNKMQNSLSMIQNKQKTQMINLQKRIDTSRTQKNLNRKKQQEKINLKYDNFQKDLKKAHQKQILGFKGQFKSLGGTSASISSPAKTRSSFGSSQGSSLK